MRKMDKSRLRRVLTWIAWAFVIQFILINISAASYADKLSYLETPGPATWTTPVSNDIFSKTWRLFTGPVMYKQKSDARPSFAITYVTLNTHKGLHIQSWYSQADSVSKGTVILFHGLMGDKGRVINEAAAFRSFGYNVMLLDVRGHGESEGKRISIGFREAEEVKLAFDYIASRGEKNIVLWGASMGAVEIIKGTAEYDLHPAGIIAEMPFQSLETHLEGRARILGFPSQPFAFLTSFWMGVEQGFSGWGFKTTRYAANIKCPVLLQYGEKDELVLRKETDVIFESLGSADKKLIVYEGAGHSQFLQKDPVTWNREVQAFLEKL